MLVSRAACIFMICTSLWNFGHSSSGTLCQSKIHRQKNVCYWVETTLTSFTKSQQRCVAQGGNLATVDSAETSEFLKEFFDSIGVTSPKVWIGYNEKKTRWEDSTLFSWSNYHPDEPNKEKEYCTSMFKSRWMDRYCSKKSMSLCQIHLSQSRKFEFVGVDEGSTVFVGDRVVVVQTPCSNTCAVQCVHDPYCFVFRYTSADKTCSLYNSGNIIKTVATHGEWYVY